MLKKNENLISIHEGLEEMLDSLKGKSMSLWFKSAFTAPPVMLEEFQWWYETDDVAERLVFSDKDSELVYHLDLEVVYNVNIDNFLKEIVFRIEDNVGVLQLFPNEVE